MPYRAEDHPEMGPGEVFLSNASDEKYPDLRDPRSSWESIGWETKRRGSIAYDIEGRRIEGMFPVFVTRSELRNAGIDPDTLFSKRH